MNGLRVLVAGTVVALGLAAGIPSVVRADADMMMKNNGMMKKEAMMQPEVAIEGYCPVCLIHGMMNKGSDNFTTEYKGKVYKFPAMEQQKAFLMDPEQYTKDLDMKFKQMATK